MRASNSFQGFGGIAHHRLSVLGLAALATATVSISPLPARADVICTAAANNTSSCPRVASLGESIVIDFASVIAANPSLFSLDQASDRVNQIRIATTTGGPLNLSNVRLIATGNSFDGDGNATPFTNRTLAAWASTASSGSTGVSNYTASQPVLNNFTQASFTLSPTGAIRGRGLTGNSYTSLKLVLENATLAAIYPTLNISLANYDPADSTNVLIFGANATLGVPAPLPLAGGVAAFSWSRRLRRRLQASRSGT